MSDIWFTIPYRDKDDRKYDIVIERISVPISRTLQEIIVNIFESNTKIGCFTIEFTNTWIASHNHHRYILKKITENNARSDFISAVVKEFIFGKDLKSLDGKEISFHKNSVHESKIYLTVNNKIMQIYSTYDFDVEPHQITEVIFKRDSQKIAMENRFARELVLKELFNYQSNTGKDSSTERIKNMCHYYDESIMNAIDTLVSRGFLDALVGGSRKLTYDGIVFVEEQLLTPFSDKIFLIAACSEDTYELIKEVYGPAAKDLGYQLIFQEKSEPKGSIHDEIWEYIKNCKLIICDLTDSRANCFIEYGYADALDKQIILCIEESEGKNEEGLMRAPFDTLTRKYSFWKQVWLAEYIKEELENFKSEIKERIEQKLAILNTQSKI